MVGESSLTREGDPINAPFAVTRCSMIAASSAPVRQTTAHPDGVDTTSGVVTNVVLAARSVTCDPMSAPLLLTRWNSSDETLSIARIQVIAYSLPFQAT